MALDHTKAENHPDCNVAHHKQYTKPLGHAAHCSIQAKKTIYTITKQLYGMLRHAQKKSACSLAYRSASLYVHIASSALLTLPAMPRATAILAFHRFLVSPGCYPDVRNSYNRKHLHLADTCRSCLRHIGRHRSYTRIPLPQPFLCRATWHHNSSRKASVMHRAKRGGYDSEAFAALPTVTAWE